LTDAKGECLRCTASCAASQQQYVEAVAHSRLFCTLLRTHPAPAFADAIAHIPVAAVAPQFKDSFKEDLDWRQIYQALAATGVKQVNAAEAYAKSKRYARPCLHSTRLQ
jgi:hypothetical protein